MRLESITRSETLGNAVFAQLHAALMDGAFKPGERITVRELADITGVSSTPAREALGRLVASGALEMSFDRSAQVPNLAEAQIREIYTLRRSLESLVVEAAARLISAADLDRLEDLVVQREAALDAKDYRSSLALNRQFFFKLFAAAAMPMALILIETLWSRIGPTLNLLYPHFAETRSGVATHRRLIAAIRSKNVVEAKRAFEADLIEAEQVILALLEKTRNAA